MSFTHLTIAARAENADENADENATYTVTIEEPATGRTQVIHGVAATSEVDAINRVSAILERNAKAHLGASAHVVVGEKKRKRS